MPGRPPETALANTARIVVSGIYQLRLEHMQQWSIRMRNLKPKKKPKPKEKLKPKKQPIPRNQKTRNPKVRLRCTPPLPYSIFQDFASVGLPCYVDHLRYRRHGLQYGVHAPEVLATADAEELLW